MDTRLAMLVTGLLLAISGGARALDTSPLGIGVVGDSLSDEYLQSKGLFTTDFAADSWVQILAQTRGSYLDFGGYKAPPNTWPDKRESGYEYNWAKVGSTASDNAVLKTTLGNFSPTLLGASSASVEAAGLAPQITAGEVGTAVVAIGSNDFFYRAYQFDANHNSSPDPNATIDQAFIDDVTNSILSAVDTLRAAGTAHVILGLIPMGTAGSTTGTESQAVLDGIAAANQQLIDGAATRGISTVKLFGWSTDSNRVDADGNVTIGDLVVMANSVMTAADLVPAGTPGAGPCNSDGMCAGASAATKYITADGIHPNTAIQGLIANQVLSAINAANGTSIPLLSDAEITSLAGVSAVPLPAAGVLFASALGLLGFARRRAGQ